jgi:hypothetical protein
MIDTGANSTILSATRAGKAQNEIGHDVEVAIEGMTLRLLHVWYVDSPFSVPDDDGINGLLGDDVLFDLDYKQTQSEIILSYQQLKCSGPVIKATNLLDMKILLPSVMIDQENIEGSLLDTGAAMLLLSEKTLKMLDPYVTETAQTSGFCTFDGCMETGAFTTTLGRVCLESVCKEFIPAKYPSWDAVGQSWLQRHDSFIISIYRRTLQICQ